MTSPIDYHYLHFVAEQFAPYKNLDFYHKWFANKTTKKQMTFLQRLIAWNMKHVSIPFGGWLYTTFLFTNKMIIHLSQWFYQYAAIQFVLLANPAASFDNGGIKLNNPYLEWDSIKPYYSESDHFLNIEGTDYFFELISYGAIQIFKKIFAKWNRKNPFNPVHF